VSRRWPATGLASLTGIAMALAFPPVGLWWLAPLSVTALVLLLRVATTGDRVGRILTTGLLLGAAFGLTCFAALTPWLLVIGPDAYLLVVAMSTAFLALFGAGAAVLMLLPGWPLWVSAWWISIEALRSREPFGGFPWGRVAHSQIDAPTMAWAAVGGVPLLGFVVVLGGAVLAWTVVQVAERRRGRALLGMAGVAVVVGSGLVLPTPTSGTPVTVAVVQGGVPSTGMDAFGRREAVLNAHLDATHQLAQDVRSGAVDAPDLVIWPENASDIDPFVDQGAYDAISAAVDDVGVPVLVGLVVDVDDGANLANQGTVWLPGDGPGQTYVKQNLVPFGEYVPFRDQLDGVISRLDRVPRDFAAGDRPGLLTLGPVQIGDVICFDVAYDGAVRGPVAEGAGLITVQTNNATYGETGQLEQQWAISRLRAVEHGRSVVVASTSGISGVIGPDGTVQERAPETEQSLTVAPVTVRQQTTMATRLGGWPEAVLALLGLGAVVAAGVSRAARRPRSERGPA
jgi:apolipoprotein N-acyltransferase